MGRDTLAEQIIDQEAYVYRKKKNALEAGYYKREGSIKTKRLWAIYFHAKERLEDMKKELDKYS